MESRFQEWLEEAARDGACAPVQVDPGRKPLREAEDLIEAWSRECHARIEAQLLLKEARRVLSRVLREETITRSNRRDALRLIRAIANNAAEY